MHFSPVIQCEQKTVNVHQKYLGNIGIFAMLALISAFPPLSTDLYLPALPEMVHALNASEAAVNLTLAVFFIVYAGSLLFWGSLSEKYGRRPMLLSGTFIYAIASVGCSFAPNINTLIIMRIVQAFGGGASTAIGTAIVKDIYTGRERERAMALVMSLVTIAPVVAPILGAILLKYFSWRASFMVLAGVGTLAFFVTLFFVETLRKEDLYQGSLLQSWGRLFVVLGNRGFRLLLLPFTLTQAVILAFIGSASYIYIGQFHLSRQAFSLIFSFNAICAVAGPMLYVWASKRISWQTIVTVSYGMILLCGLMLATVAPLSPYLFALSMIPGTLAVTVTRVPNTNLMLEQMETDTGSLSALISFFTLALGTVGMLITSHFPGHQIQAMAGTNLVIGTGCGLLWIYARRQPEVKMLPDHVCNIPPEK